MVADLGILQNPRRTVECIFAQEHLVSTKKWVTVLGIASFWEQVRKIVQNLPPTVKSADFPPNNSAVVLSIFLTVISTTLSVFTKSSLNVIRVSNVPTVKDGTSNLNISGSFERTKNMTYTC